MQVVIRCKRNEFHLYSVLNLTIIRLFLILLGTQILVSWRDTIILDRRIFYWLFIRLSLPFLSLRLNIASEFRAHNRPKGVLKSSFNVCFKKTWTNHSSDTVLQFVQVFLNQILLILQQQISWVQKAFLLLWYNYCHFKIVISKWQCFLPFDVENVLKEHSYITCVILVENAF